MTKSKFCHGQGYEPGHDQRSEFGHRSSRPKRKDLRDGSIFNHGHDYGTTKMTQVNQNTQ